MPEDEVALFPGPTQLSVACSTEKRERVWYGRKGLIVCVQQGSEKHKEQRYQVTCHAYLAIRGNCHIHQALST